MKHLIIAAALTVASLAPAHAIPENEQKAIDCAKWAVNLEAQELRIQVHIRDLESLLTPNGRIEAIYRHGLILDEIREAEETAEKFKPCKEGTNVEYVARRMFLAEDARLMVHAAKALGIDPERTPR